MNRQVEQQILNFVQEVSPLYVAREWLGAKNPSSDAEALKEYTKLAIRLFGITKDLYERVERQALREPDEYQSASTGRIIVWYDAGGPDDIGAIRFGLDLGAVYYDEGTRSFIT